MFRTHYLAAALSLPLLVAACSDDPSQPGGPRAEPPPRPATPALATRASRYQIREVAASAGFESFDPSGCVETSVFVLGAAQTTKERPGKPATGPLAFVAVFQSDFCTGELLRDIEGETREATFQADRGRLTTARLRATTAGFDFLAGEEVRVEVDVTWSGTGELAPVSNRFRLQEPGLVVRQWFEGAVREAAASGTVAVGGENLTPNAPDFAQIFRAREGELDVVRTR